LNLWIKFLLLISKNERSFFVWVENGKRILN
jgi:hypothetical protein